MNFLKIYKELCLRCLNEEAFVKELYSYAPVIIKGRRLWSEVVTYYLNKTGKDKDLVTKMDLNEFANIDKAYANKTLEESKSLHLFYGGSKYDEMDYVCLFSELRNSVEEFLGKDFISSLKPNRKRTISLFNKNFGEHMYNLSKKEGYKGFKTFIDESIKFVELN